jgi:hypothetical protein
LVSRPQYCTSLVMISWSKEDTNNKYLNNLRLARQRLTNLQHLLKCRQNRRVVVWLIRSDCVGGADKGLSLKEARPEVMKGIRWIDL